MLLGLSVCVVDSMRDFWGCGDGGTKWAWANCEDKETIWKTFVEKWKKVRGHWEGGVVLLVIHVCLVRAEKEKEYSLSPTGMTINGASEPKTMPNGDSSSNR